MSWTTSDIITTKDGTNISINNDSTIIGGSDTTISNANSVAIGTSTTSITLNPATPKLYLKDNFISIRENSTYTTPGTISAATLSTGYITFTTSGGSYTFDTTVNIRDTLLDSTGTSFTDLRPTFSVLFYNTSGASISLNPGTGQTIVNETSPIVIPDTNVRLLYFIFTSNTTMIIQNMPTGPGTNVVYTNDISIDSVSLETGGEVVIQSGSGILNYKIINAFTSAFGSTNFAGGDRDLIITSGPGTYSYGTISAANLSSATSTSYTYGNGIILPTTNSVSTPIGAGNSIVVKYTGGTTDYTSGVIVLSIVLYQFS